MTDGISYIDDSPRTEPRSTIEPIIISQLIDFHPLLIIWRRYHQGHVNPNPPRRPRRAAKPTEHAVLLCSRCNLSVDIDFDPTSVVQMGFDDGHAIQGPSSGSARSGTGDAWGSSYGHTVSQEGIAPTIGFSRPDMQDDVVDTVAGTCALRLRAFRHSAACADEPIESMYLVRAGGRTAVGSLAKHFSA